VLAGRYLGDKESSSTHNHSMQSVTGESVTLGNCVLCLSMRRVFSRVAKKLYLARDATSVGFERSWTEADSSMLL
jgi:hypothetical protein